MFLLVELPQPLGSTEDETEAAHHSPAPRSVGLTVAGAGDALVAEGKQFLGLTAPGRAAAKIESQACTADFSTVAPHAITGQTVTHNSNSPKRHH